MLPGKSDLKRDFAGVCLNICLMFHCSSPFSIYISPQGSITSNLQPSPIRYVTNIQRSFSTLDSCIYVLSNARNSSESKTELDLQMYAQ